MSGLWAVCERELRSLLRQPLAWLLLGLFLFTNGLFFVQLMEEYSTLSSRVLTAGTQIPELTLVDRVVRALIVADTFVFMFLLPALTMRQLSEEQRSRTMDLLLSYPLRESQIVGGKFLASALITALMVGLVLLELLVTGLWGRLEIDVVLLGGLGLFLHGLMVLALGLLFSAWTENQILAFTGTLAAQLFLLLVGFWGMRVEGPLSAVLRHLDFSGHVGEFGFGVFRLSSLLFFVGLTLLFLYAAGAMLARRRWHEEG